MTPGLARKNMGYTRAEVIGKVLKPSALIHSLARPFKTPFRPGVVAVGVKSAWGFLRQGASFLRRRWYWVAVVLLLVAADVWLITNNTVFRGRPVTPTVTVETQPQNDASRPLAEMPQPVGPKPSGSPSAPSTRKPVEANQAPAAETAPAQPAAPEALPTGPVVEPGAMLAPVEGDLLRSFGFQFSDLYGDYRLHAGIDLGAPKGTPVNAVLDGRVEAVEYSDLFRYRITLDHGDGWQTRYSHVDQVQVRKGQRVAAGETLALVGEPGLEEQLDDTHLHFELRQDGKPLDPSKYLLP